MQAEGEDEKQIQNELRSDSARYFAKRRKNKRKPPRKSFPMVLNLGVMGYFCADLTLRVVAIAVLTYSVGELATALLLPALFTLWIGTRLLVWQLARLKHNGYGDLTSVVESYVRDFKRILTPSFMDAGLTARRLSYDFLISTLACIAFTAIGLLPQMPHPHVDPDFRSNAVAIVAAAVVVKYVTFIWCVFPAGTLLYPILGIGKVRLAHGTCGWRLPRGPQFWGVKTEQS